MYETGNGARPSTGYSWGDSHERVGDVETFRTNAPTG